jgi:single stranded DNA-binding protein
MDYQKTIIVGNATKDAEVHQPEGKTAYADFTLGVSRTKDQTTFFPVRVFGKLAETSENVKKGAKVLVGGKLDISEYTDKEGQKRMTFRILADTYRLL